ncbi:MAG: hypothetical protein HQL81_02480 [Magnetococcales bacterium]|nr:hypothetical protein [Magnetococcales bacterium]
MKVRLLKGTCGMLIASMLCVSGMAWADEEKLLDELRQVLEEGRRTRAAKPEFLNKLDRILNQARGGVARFLLRDRFDDGDYEVNPSWTVVTGNFHVDASGALFSSMASAEALPMQEGGGTVGAENQGKQDADMKMVMGIVGLLADGKFPGQGAGSQTAKGGRGSDGQKDGKGIAIIHVPISTENTFHLRFLFRADSALGQGEVGLFLGQELRSGYRLLMNADPNRDKTVEIVRYHESRHPESVAMIPGNGLGDGLNHELTWKRTDNGTMTVGLDGRNILQTRDVAINQGFDGLVLINRGGDMAFDNIELSAGR